MFITLIKTSVPRYRKPRDIVLYINLALLLILRIHTIKTEKMGIVRAAGNLLATVEHVNIQLLGAPWRIQFSILCIRCGVRVA